MNKKILTAITILCCTILCTMPFSVKAAQAGINVSGVQGYPDDGFILSYQYDMIYANFNEYLSLDSFGVENNLYKSAFVLHVQFDVILNGSIDLYFRNGGLSNVDGYYIQGSAQLQSVGSSLVTVNLVNCQEFVLILALYEANTGLTYDGSLTDIDVDVFNTNTFQSYQIPVESVPAYIFTTSDPNNIVYNFGDAYPHYHVSNGTVGQTVRFYALARDQHCYYIFFTKDTITSTRTLTLNRSNTVSMTVNAVNPYTASSYRLYIAEFTVPSDSALNEIKWGFETDVYPVFFGFESQMTDTLRGLAGLQTIDTKILDALNTNNMRLQQIINILMNDSSGTSNDIDSTTDAVNDLIEEEQDITDGFLDDLTGFNTDMDLTEYNFTTLFMDANNYFKNQLDTMYTDSGGFKGYWVIPIILVILTVLLGR